MTKNPFVKAVTKRKFLKILLYGDTGVGKTWFALSFPSPAVIDTEGGTDFYADSFDFSVIDTRSFSEVMAAVDFLEKENHGFETVVIDPITTVYEALQNGRLEFKAKKNKSDDESKVDTENIDFSPLDWGSIKRNYKSLMTRLVNLDMHVILIARQKDKTEKNKKGEMIKIGETFDGEKGTPYNLDIFGKLIVEGNKRVILIEKSRLGDWDKGSRIENPSFESFKHLVNNGNGQQVHHSSEDEAATKDGVFFQERENKPSTRLLRDNENKGINAPTVQNLFTWFGALGMPKDSSLRYKQYCYEKYHVDHMQELTPDQLLEQRSILFNAMNVEAKKQAFCAHIAEYSIPEKEIPVPTSLIDIPVVPETQKPQELPLPLPAKTVGNGKESGLRVQINTMLRTYYRADDNLVAQYLIKELPAGRNGIDEMTATELAAMKKNIKALMEAVGNGNAQQAIVTESEPEPF